MKVFEVKRAFTHLLALLFFASASANLVGCGAKGGVGGGSNTGADVAAAQPSQLDKDLAALDQQAFVAGGPFNKHQIITIDKVNKTITFSVPLPTNPWGVGITAPIPELPGATASLAQDPITGQWSFSVTVPLKDLIKGISQANPTTLPNGQPLPAVPGGTLPSVASHITINGKANINFYLYGSIKYFAIFFPTPWFNPMVQLQFPIMNASKTKILGYFDTIPNSSATSGNNGGLYFTMIFPVELQRVLDDLFPSGP